MPKKWPVSCSKRRADLRAQLLLVEGHPLEVAAEQQDLGELGRAAQRGDLGVGGPGEQAQQARVEARCRRRCGRGGRRSGWGRWRAAVRALGGQLGQRRLGHLGRLLLRQQLGQLASSCSSSSSSVFSQASRLPSSSPASSAARPRPCQASASSAVQRDGPLEPGRAAATASSIARNRWPISRATSAVVSAARRPRAAGRQGLAGVVRLAPDRAPGRPSARWRLVCSARPPRPCPAPARAVRQRAPPGRPARPGARRRAARARPSRGPARWPCPGSAGPRSSSLAAARAGRQQERDLRRSRARGLRSARGELRRAPRGRLPPGDPRPARGRRASLRVVIFTGAYFRQGVEGGEQIRTPPPPSFRSARASRSGGATSTRSAPTRSNSRPSRRDQGA